MRASNVGLYVGCSVGYDACVSRPRSSSLSASQHIVYKVTRMKLTRIRATASSRNTRILACPAHPLRAGRRLDCALRIHEP